MAGVLSVLGSAGPYALFLAMCVYEVVAYRRGWVVSPADHKRAIDVEQRIASHHEKRADIAEARADKADAALRALNAELPAALHALAQSKAGAS